MCPALAQSRPCNMNPCLTTSFSVGYCNRALRKCTRYRALERGCHTVTKVYGNGPAITKTLLDEHHKMEHQIKVIQNHEGRGDANGTYRKIIRQEDAKAVRTVKRIIQHANGDRGHVATKGTRKAKRQSRTSKHQVATDLKVAGSLNDKDSPSVSPESLNKAIPTAQHGSKPRVRFQFHNNGKGKAAVVGAVKAAEHAISAKEGADAVAYNFKISSNSAPVREVQELGESSQVTSPAKTNEHRGTVKRMISAADAAHKLAVHKQKHMSKIEKERCLSYVHGVAHYCGRMADCVSKTKDQADISISKKLTKQVEQVEQAAKSPVRPVPTPASERS